jgi:NADPH-dependent 2,4-dienoyl-CoA reductase/sulfur reductase-like enzyme
VTDNIVVVGTSLAGVRAARGLRHGGYGGRITLVGREEHYPPFDRPPLSKQVLSGAWPEDRARLKHEDLGELQLLLGVSAVALDPVAKQVVTTDSALDYDGLVIASGAGARRLPVDEQVDRHIFTLRTVEDSLRLRERFGPGHDVVVIGAGFLGCEIAAVARQRGSDVTLLDICDVPMQAALGQTVGEVVAAQHRYQGVRLRLGTVVEKLAVEGDGLVLQLDDGDELRPHTVVAAVGAVPETGWLLDSGLRVDDGVVCDEACFAEGTDDVVAVGDVARWQHPLLRRSVRVEHWTNAATQAEHGGRNLVARLTGGEVEPYDALPYFWTHQYDWRLQFVGSRTGELVVEEGALEESKFVATFRDDQDGVVGAVCLNRADRVAALTREIRDYLE